MRERRMRGRRALALGVACLALVGSVRAGDHARTRPENAVPTAETRRERLHLSGVQKRAIAREALGASTRRLLQAPVRGTTQLAGRLVERIAVRLGEVATCLGVHPRRCDGDSAHDFDGGDGGPPTPARLVLLPTNEASIQGLINLIASARVRFDLMIYGWQDDPTGREVATALEAAARRGVRVRLLVDRAAYLIHNERAARGEWTFLDALKRVPNVTLIEPMGAFFRFDHRKLAVRDGAVAWSGGMILTEDARRHWHNLAFLAEGPIVAQYAAVFEERWRAVGGTPEPPPGPLSAPSGPANAIVRLIQTDDRERSLKNTIYHAVDHARHHVFLENCYFSDEILTGKLAAAARRGVEVHAVLTLRGNIELLNRYSTVTANRLLRAGVHVYLYPAMTHVKAMSADGTWAYLGTGNFDELSLRNNREVSLSVIGPEVVAALDRELFLPDIARSQPLLAPLPCPSNFVWLELLSLWY